METGDFRGDVDRAIAAGDASGAARMLASAWELEPGSAMAGFVASRYDRIAGRLGLLRQRWAILRSFTVEPLVPVFKAGAYAAGIALETHLGEFNAYAQEILDPGSALYRFQPDAAILAVQTRDVAPGLWQGEPAPDDVLGRFGDWIGSFRKYSKAALIVHSLDVPAVPCAGILDAQRADNAAEAIQGINRGLRALAGEYRGVYILDYHALVARHGRERWGDARKWLTVRLRAKRSTWRGRRQTASRAIRGSTTII